MKKKIISIIVIIVLLIPIIQYILKEEHHTKYKVNNYSIEEHFYQDIKNYYNFILENKGKTYIMSYLNKKGKQKRIIKDIKTIKQNNLQCIIPTFTKKKDYSIACILDNEQVSIDYLIKTNNKDFQTIKKQLKKYNLSFPTASDKKNNYKSLTVYNNNIDNNSIYYLWNYKGLFIINAKENKYQKVLDYDLYDNIEACSVKDYYIILENNSVSGIKNIYYYHNNKLSNYKLSKTISKNSYINGVINNKVYITDRDNKKEYSLDIQKKKWKEIDQDETTYIIYSNKEKKEVSKSDFFMEDQIFKINRIGDYYYFQEANKIYKRIDNHKVLLLELEDIKEWWIKGNNIILLQGDTIYSYNETNGLRKIIENNELKYNYQNIVQVGEKA